MRRYDALAGNTASRRRVGNIWHKSQYAAPRGSRAATYPVPANTATSNARKAYPSTPNGTVSPWHRHVHDSLQVHEPRERQRQPGPPG